MPDKKSDQVGSVSVSTSDGKITALANEKSLPRTGEETASHVTGRLPARASRSVAPYVVSKT
jgi:hypothetical protein